MSSLRIEAIKVKNFRNLEEKILSFNPQINCVFGENGNGKTNILEAIYFLLKRKSFRKKVSFPHLVSMDCGKPYFLISSKIYLNKHYSLSCKCERENTEFYMDSLPYKERNKFPVVYISPVDSFDFFRDRSFRKSWLETGTTIMFPQMNDVFKKYNKLIKQRNYLLQNKGFDFHSQLKAIDKNFAILSFNIQKYTSIFLERIKKIVYPIFQDLFGEKLEIELFLKSDLIGENPDEILNKIESAQLKDLSAGITTIGPHHNDLEVFLQNQNALEFSSLGQQKMIYLSLQFSLAFYHVDEKSFQPLILIDDLSGELDKRRWINLVDFLSRCESQIFITSANSAFQQELLKIGGSKHFWVDKGRVSEQQVEQTHLEGQISSF